MKKISLILLVTVLLSISCSDDVETKISRINITAEQRELIVSDGPHSLTIELEASGLWGSRASDTWLKCLPNMGSGGMATVNILIEDNKGLSPRTAYISFSCGTATDTVFVSQAPRRSIIVENDTYLTESCGGDIDVRVVSNVDLTVNCDEEWLSYVPSKAMTERIVTLRVQPNDDRYRSASVTISNDTLKSVIKIHQRGRIDEEEIEEERKALIAFYHATDGDHWKDKSGVFEERNTNWLSDKPLGEWQGVRTDEMGHVISLTRVSETLSGYLPPEIGKLKYLKTLDLRGDPEIGGIFPPEICQLENLETLILEGTSINGEIPADIGRCTKLKKLMLADNKLTGSIPASVANLKELRVFSAVRNNLSGEIPAFFGDLKHLQHVYLSSNMLTGRIPEELVKCKELLTFDVSSNMLEGTIPAGFAIPWCLDVAGNNLSGDLPPDLTANPDFLSAHFGNLLYGNKFNTSGLHIPGIYFDVTDFDNVRYQSAKEYFTNKLTVIFQWSSFCAAAEGMVEVMERLYSEYHDRGFQVIGYTWEDVAYVRSLNLSFPNVYCNKNPLGRSQLTISTENIYSPEHMDTREFGVVTSYPYFVVPTVTAVDNTGFIVFSDIIDNPFDFQGFVTRYFEDE